MPASTCPACGATWERSAARAEAVALCRACRNARALERVRPRQEAVNAVKVAKGCADCGWTGPAVALDFDHGDGPKACSIATLVTRTSVPLDELLAAAEACEVVCARCHRLRTAERGHFKGWRGRK